MSSHWWRGSTLYWYTTVHWGLCKINIQNSYMLIFRLFEDKMIQQAPDELYTLHTDNTGGRWRALVEKKQPGKALNSNPRKALQPLYLGHRRFNKMVSEAPLVLNSWNSPIPKIGTSWFPFCLFSYFSLFFSFMPFLFSFFSSNEH